MIPFRHTDERVFAAMWKLDELHHETSVYTVRLHPSLYKSVALILSPGFSRSPDGSPRLFGMPLEYDGRLRRGEIVLRHEVEA